MLPSDHISLPPEQLVSSTLGIGRHSFLAFFLMTLKFRSLVASSPKVAAWLISYKQNGIYFFPMLYQLRSPQTPTKVDLMRIRRGKLVLINLEWIFIWWCRPFFYYCRCPASRKDNITQRLKFWLLIVYKYITDILAHFKRGIVQRWHFLFQSS